MIRSLTRLALVVGPIAFASALGGCSSLAKVGLSLCSGGAEWGGGGGTINLTCPATQTAPVSPVAGAAPAAPPSPPAAPPATVKAG